MSFPYDTYEGHNPNHDALARNYNRLRQAAQRVVDEIDEQECDAIVALKEVLNAGREVL
jgi:hypothetical protein